MFFFYVNGELRSIKVNCFRGFVDDLAYIEEKFSNDGIVFISKSSFNSSKAKALNAANSGFSFSEPIFLGPFFNFFPISPSSRLLNAFIFAMLIDEVTKGITI